MRIIPLFTSGGCSARTFASTYTEDLYFICSNSVLTPEKMYMLQGADITFLGTYSGIVVVGDSRGNVCIISDSVYTGQLGIGTGSVMLDPERSFLSVQVVGIDPTESKKEVAVTKFKVEGKIHLVGMAANKVLIFNSFEFTAIDSYGDFVFVGCVFGFLKIYKKDKLVVQVKAHEDAIRDLKARPLLNNILIATGSQDKLIKIWCFSRSQGTEDEIKKVDVLEGHTDWVTSIKWDDNNLVSSSFDNSILFWKMEDGGWRNKQRLGHFREKNRAFYNVISIQGPGARGIVGERYATEKQVGSIVIGQSHSGGFYLYIDEKLSPFISGHLGEIKSIDWNGEFLLTSGVDRTARIFRKNQEVSRVIEHGYPINSAIWTCRASSCKNSAVYDTEDAKPIENSFGEDSNIEKRLSIAVCSQETIIRVMEPTKLFLLSQGLKGGDVFNATNAELSLTNENQEEGSYHVNEYSLSNNRFSEGKKVYGHYFEVCAITASSSRIFSANKASDYKFSGIFIWNKEMEQIGYTKCHSLGINRLRVSNCENYLLAASRDKSVSMYKITSMDSQLDLVAKICDHRRSVFDCGFNYDSSLFGTVSRDKRLLIYTLEPSLVYEKKYEHEAMCISFSKRSNIVCVGLENGDIDILDIEAKASKRIKAHGKGVTCAEFNHTNLLATGGSDGILRVFEIKTEESTSEC